MTTADTRQLWTKIHRWLGLAALAFLFVAGLTGSVLCFDKRIDAHLNSDLFYRQANAAPRPLPQVAADVQARYPKLVVTQFPLKVGPSETLKLDVSPSAGSGRLGFDQLFVDPSDGRIVGVRQSGPGWDRRHIVEGIFQFHQNVLAGKAGRWIMGLAALFWFIGNFVGLYLTFPVKKPFWPKWKKKWKIDSGANMRRLMLEIHNASGLWLLIPATVLAYTSVAMNFFDEAFTPAVQAMSPARPSIFDGPAHPTPPGASRIGFPRALALASSAAKDRGLTWQPALERYNVEHDVYGISFTDNGIENYHRLGPVTLYVDARTGRVVDADDPYHDSFGRKASRSLYPLHSGEIIGPIGIAIIFLLGLSTTEMCVTGFYTWWKKRASRSGKRMKSRPRSA